MEDEILPRLPDAIAEPALRDFISQGAYDRDVVPKRCDPALVERLLYELAAPDAGSRRHSKALELSTLYSLRGMATYYANAMTAEMGGGGRLDEGSQGSLVMLVALLGSPDEAEISHGYYDRVMLPAPTAHRRVPMLIACLIALGPRFAPGRLPGFVENWSRTADQREPNPDDAYFFAQELARAANDEMPRALAAIARRAEIAALPGTEQVRRVLRLYARIDAAHAEALSAWTVAHVALIANGTIERRQAFSALLRDELTALPEAALPEATADFARVRLLRAVEYVTPSALSDAEKSELAAALDLDQEDPISTVQPTLVTAKVEGAPVQGGIDD